MLLIALLAVLGLIFLGVGIGMWKHNEWSCYEGFIILAVTLLVVAIMLGCISWYSYAFRDATFEVYSLKYNSLIAQLDGNYYNRITYDGRKALMDDVINYNTRLVRCRAKHHSRWVGALYPEDWDALPLIEF